jgi:regulator of RNase E activity RraA
LASASSTTLATSAAIKTYIDTNVGNLGNLEGAWDASGGTFPVGSSPVAGTKAGDYWYVSVAGTTGGVAFNVGDVIVAKVNSASTSSAADWIQLEVNRDQATETALGLAEIATQTEVNTGTDDQRIVTPLKLKTLLDNRTGGYAANIGNGSATSYAVSHGLGTIDVNVMLKDNSTLAQVFADVVVTDANTVTVSFAVAPASNAYRVIIKK